MSDPAQGSPAADGDRPAASPARAALSDGGPIGVAWLGTVRYAEALDLQERLRDARIAGAIGDTVLLLQHPPVYTRGRRASPEELPMGTDWYAARGIEIVDVRRGGKVTFHGPGQLVGYVLVRTGDVIAIVRALERAMVAVARAHGVDARGRNDEGIEYTGVWVQGRKVGSIGLHLSRGVTTHGVGLNVVTDLDPFGWIVPCGLTEPMTSLARETSAPDLGSDPALDAAAIVRAVGEEFAAALGRELGATTESADAEVLRAAAAAGRPVAG